MLFKQLNKNFPLLVTISKKHEFAWFRMPKVASSSIKENFRNLVNEELNLKKRVKSINVKNNYFKFTFVRNPWDRIASCHRQKIENSWKYAYKRADSSSKKLKSKGLNFKNNELTLNEFLILLEKGNNRFYNIHWAPQTSIVDMDKMDFIGRFENLEEDWKYVCKKIGIDQFELPHKLQTKPKDQSYRDYYKDQESIDIVSRIYAEEIKRFNYKF